ncbi:MAG: hypothetical protein F7B59_02455 [Desulfurococcales archaeon]|nr:hypothetical protein [Desulfurococcales archaeon]
MANRDIMLELLIVVAILSLIAYSLHYNSTQTSIPRGTRVNTTSTTSITSNTPPIGKGGGRINFSVIRLGDACRFIESQEADHLGLVVAAKEGSGVDSTRIYLLHDNYLAMHALETCNSSLAWRINESLGRYNVTGDPRYGVLFGYPYMYAIPLGNHTYPVKDIFVDGRNLTIMIDNISSRYPLKNWLEYVDWVELMGINDLLKGNYTGSLKLYFTLMDKWDGYGFTDKTSGNKNGYDLYKLALAVYYYRALENCGFKVDNSFLNKALTILKDMQGKDGGFHTGYLVKNGAIVPLGGENVETTSLVIISLYQNPPVCSNNQ